MFDEGSGMVRDRPASQELLSPKTEYVRCIKALNSIGIISLLPQSESLGVIGIDGKEYPVPSVEQIQDLLHRNKKIVEAKKKQGFIRLQLTPFAMPLTVLADRVWRLIIKHAKTGTIFQAKRDPKDKDIPVLVDQEEPIYTYVSMKTDTSGTLVYFPRSYDKNHHGFDKNAVIKAKNICAFPGWSVTLIEDSRFLSQEGQGETLSGRKQLETNRTDTDYLSTLRTPMYKEETGLTLEDFLVDFATVLSERNQVSYDTKDNSAVCLTGAFLKSGAFVPSAFWNRGAGRLNVYENYPDARSPHWGGRFTVRLSS